MKNRLNRQHIMAVAISTSFALFMGCSSGGTSEQSSDTSGNNDTTLPDGEVPPVVRETQSVKQSKAKVQ